MGEPIEEIWADIARTNRLLAERLANRADRAAAPDPAAAELPPELVRALVQMTPSQLAILTGGVGKGWTDPADPSRGTKSDWLGFAGYLSDHPDWAALASRGLINTGSGGGAGSKPYATPDGVALARLIASLPPPPGDDATGEKTGKN